MQYTRPPAWNLTLLAALAVLLLPPTALTEGRSRLARGDELAGVGPDELFPAIAWGCRGRSHSSTTVSGVWSSVSRCRPCARDAYTRSLKIEWNQPPIIEAISRVERLME